MNAAVATAPAPAVATGMPRPQRQAITSKTMGYRRYVIGGGILALVFFGGFGGWAAMADLSSAAIAHGSVVVGSARKTVQHYEGGIVGQIFVKDGQQVQAGDPVIALDETQPRASLGVLNVKYRAAAARQARALAESRNLTQIPFPDWLRAEATKDPAVAEMLEIQERLFRTRKESIESQTAILQRRIAQYREEINGLRAELQSDAKQYDLIREELADVRVLVDKGLERRTRLRALERGMADIEGTRARNTAAIARSQQSIAESELRILDLRTQLANEVATELRDTQNEINDTNERLVAARDVLQRTLIKAPVSGTVMNMQIFTTGGVIGQRQPLMDIVPAGDDLMIEAQIDPNDIDVVHPGESAQVRLLAYSPRTTPELTGKVETVSPDKLTNEKTGAPYYNARIKLDPESVQKLHGLSLYPGMQAEVIIVSGNRTVLSYLVKPLTGVFSRAMRQD